MGAVARSALDVAGRPVVPRNRAVSSEKAVLAFRIDAVYTSVMQVARAKLFQNGGSQAVRLPRECRFPEGQREVTVRREGARVILEPVDMWPEDFRKFFHNFITTFPDMHLEVLDIVAEDGKAVVRWQARGTHQAEAFGIAATKRLFEFSGVSWFEVRDGQIVGGGDSWNLHGLIARMSAVTGAEA